MDIVWQWLGLWFSAFSSATILPGTSDVVLLAFVNANPQLWLGALLLATLGNGMGSGDTNNGGGHAGGKGLNGYAALDAYLDRLAEPKFSHLGQAARDAASPGALLAAAQALYRWRRDVIREG